MDYSRFFNEEKFISWLDYRRKQLLDGCNNPDCYDGHVPREGTHLVKKCPDCLHFLKYETMLYEGGVPEKYWYQHDFDVRKIHGPIDKYLTDLNKKRHSIVFYGENGSGKTECGSYILREVALKYNPVFYTSVLNLGMALRSIDSGDKKTAAWLYENLDKPIVFFDEVGAEICNSFTGESLKLIFSHYVRSRYENNKPTILATNLTRDKMAKEYGEGILSIINASDFVRCNLPSRDHRGSSNKK